MSKRAHNFDRKPNDKYYTPFEAAAPVLQFVPPKSTFVEPCAGDGRLIRHFQKFHHKCVYACDIAPEGEGIVQRDILFFDNEGFPTSDFIITNPPWDRELLHPMLDVFMDHAPSWLLFDADWHHTVQAMPFIHHCRMIVSIGRVSWEGNGKKGMDNACWYLFDRKYNGYPQFVLKPINNIF